MPLPVEYKGLLKTPSPHRNLVARWRRHDGRLVPAEFVPEGAAWVHLDIAGPFWRSKPWKYYGEGPTGVGVRTLAELARNWMDFMHP